MGIRKSTRSSMLHRRGSSPPQGRSAGVRDSSTNQTSTCTPSALLIAWSKHCVACCLSVPPECQVSVEEPKISDTPLNSRTRAVCRLVGVLLAQTMSALRN